MRESFVYDKMGNITGLSRFGKEGIIDRLQITYDGNRVKNINESVISSNRYSQKEYFGKSTSNEKFRYDANGNTTSDLDRDIVTIRYNLLNLPEIIQFRNGSQIVNKYDAAGTKLESRFITCIVIASVPVGNVSTFQASGLNRVYRENRTYYCGNYEYSFDGTMRTPVLSKIHNSEGYKDGRDIKNDVLHYYRRDHLGNVREVWKSGVSGVVSSPFLTVQRMQYYPSGLPWADCTGADYQNRKYNGKEFIEMHGYDSYDYHARHMYPALMRFTTPDPLAEMKPWLTTYHFCSNNPIVRVDPSGMLDDWIYDIQKKEYVWDGRVSSRSETPSGYSYVGPSLKDVSSHYKNTNPIKAIFKGANFGENRTSWTGELNIPDVLTTAEMWMEEPSKNIGEGILKIVANVAYSIANSPFSMLTGKTIGGTPLNSTEKMDAFIEVVPGLLSSPLTKTGQVIKTSKGLQGFNQFIKKSPGITSTEGLPAGMKWQTRAGQSFQKNKIQQQSLKDYNVSRNVIDAESATKKELEK